MTLGASWTRNQAAAQRAGEAAWHAGRTEVWVDPGDPAQATLDPASGAALLRPVLFAIIGVALVAFAVHRWRSAKASAA